MVVDPVGRISALKAVNQTTVANENELLGNLIGNFPTIKIHYRANYYEEIPKIFFLLTTYFQSHSEHLKREGLFRVNGERAKIKALDTHLSLGDFSVL